MVKPLSDQLIDRIRRDNMRGDDDLRESLKSFGWLEQLPAIMDERGVTLVGHRRIRIAGELGIRCVIRTVSFGEGDEADAGRVALALASNLGAKPMTSADRKSISLYLFNEREWSIERIAKALRVGLNKIRRDLRDGPPPEVKSSRKPGEEQKQRSINANPADWAAFKARADAEGKSVAEKLGEMVREPEVDPKTLPKTAQEKLAAALRQQRTRQDAEYQQRLSAGIKAMLEDTVLPHYAKLKAEAEAAVRARKGIMSRDQYRLVLSCLHPDSRANVSDEKLREAFQVFKALELVLVADIAPSTYTSPRTYDDLMAMRRRAKNGAGAKP